MRSPIDALRLLRAGGERRSKSEEGLKHGETAVAKKAIVFTAEVAEGRGGKHKTGGRNGYY